MGRADAGCAFDPGPKIALIRQFDLAQSKILLIGVLEKVCKLAIVRQVTGIVRALVTPPAKGSTEYLCTTEGVNLTGAWAFGHHALDLDRIYSNDVAALMRTYGIEAARSVIIKEVSGVFAVYGIAVDPRHLTLVADYMVRDATEEA